MTWHRFGVVLDSPFCTAICPPIFLTNFNDRALLCYPPPHPVVLPRDRCPRQGLAPGVPTHHVTTPPMVGSTWPRVRSTLGSDCSPALSQGATSLCLVVDLLIIIFTVAAHIRCLMIGVVLVRLIGLLMFSFSYTRPWGLFSYRPLGPLTWYSVSHDGLSLALLSPPISADALWDSICFQYS